MTAANAVMVHRLPGRVRLRLEDKRGDTDYFSTLSEEIAGVPGIDSIKVNPMTGSVVIIFSGTTEELIRQLGDRQLVVEIPQEPESKQRAAMAGSSNHVEPFLLVSNRDINPMFMLGSVLSVIGIVQAFRGKILVSSLSALWYALQAFRQAQAQHPPHVATNETEKRQAGLPQGLSQGPGSSDLVH